MATEKVGVYRRWLEPVPQKDGRPIPKDEWPKKRRHSWTVRWYGTTGKRYSKDFKTRKLADRYARDLQGQVEIRKQDKPTKIALRDFIEEHASVMTGQVAYASLIDQRRALRLFEKYIGSKIGLHEIKPRHAESFIAHRLSAGIAVGTANKDIRTLKSIFNRAIDLRGYLLAGQNPFRRIRQQKKAPKPLRYVSIDEYQGLMQSARRLWWQGIISLAYGSGLRKGEMLNLTWADVDFENQYIHIRVKESTVHTSLGAEGP